MGKARKIVAGIVIGFTILILIGAVGNALDSQNKVSNAVKDVDDKAGNLVKACNNVNVMEDPTTKGRCDAELLNFWNTDCSQYHDQMKNCATGSEVYKYLKDDAKLI